MPRVIDLGSRALLDIGSYGRRCPGQQRTLLAAEVAHVVRTARGAPEVVVKVSGGATTTRGVGTHLDYIGREGEQEIETDDGQRISELGFERRLPASFCFFIGCLVTFEATRLCYCAARLSVWNEHCRVRSVWRSQVMMCAGAR